MTLSDIASKIKKAVALTRLKSVPLSGWETRKSNGGEYYKGVLVHHTGSYDTIGDTSSDLAYAKWMGLTGRPDLDPPLCNIALSAEGVVYPTAAGNANHGGTARASGPMPSGDANSMYIGIEAMNSGSQGWSTKGKDLDGKTVTQYQAYIRLCAALCVAFGWPASHVRAHRETSSTGKWDPGLIDMEKFRRDVAAKMKEYSKPVKPSTEKMDPAAYFFGAKGDHVLWYKGRLKAHGLSKGVSLSSNFYGSGAKAATVAFQKAQGWSGSDADGFPGKETLKRLAAPKARKTPAKKTVAKKAVPK